MVLLCTNNAKIIHVTSMTAKDSVATQTTNVRAAINIDTRVNYISVLIFSTAPAIQSLLFLSLTKYFLLRFTVH